MCIGWHIEASNVPTVQQGGGDICEDIKVITTLLVKYVILRYIKGKSCTTVVSWMVNISVCERGLTFRWQFLLFDTHT